MKKRGKVNQTALAFWMTALLGGGGALALAQEAPVEQWSWARVEAWALALPEPAPQKPPPIASPEPKTTPEIKGPLPPTPSVPPKPLIRTRHGEPNNARNVLGGLRRYMGARFNEAFEQNQFRIAWALAFTMERYPDAMACLKQVALHEVKYRREKESGWNDWKMLETALLNGSYADYGALLQVTKDWSAQVDRFIQANRAGEANLPYHLQRLDETRKKRLAFFEASKNLFQEMTELEIKGEKDPEALWELAQRFKRDEPRKPVSMLLTLYKLLEWHPTFEKTKNGEVQYLLASYLLDDFWPSHEEMGDVGNNYSKKFASDLWVLLQAVIEAQAVAERWPQSPRVLSGDADWLLAEALRERGNWFGKLKKMDSYTTAQWGGWMGTAEPLVEASKSLGKANELYEIFQEKYKKHAHNQRHRNLSGALNPSTCMNRLQEVRQRLRDLQPPAKKPPSTQQP